jgi:TonB-dependent receptor
MYKLQFRIALILLALSVISSALGQSGKGIVTGSVKDLQAASLPGGTVELQPGGRRTVSDGQGAFTITDVVPGTYTVTISYVGFATFSGSVAVVAGQTAHIDAVLKVANASQEVIVTGERLFGEAEAINRTRAAENILQVLPAEVIVSLPNANIADALGRMASVTIERDEGEGKYVQIRGTEPRLSNTMVDGVTIPSPESGVRQIKLDTIASDLVDSVEINKTLQANIDADGIGGSVNLVTKTATDTPTITVYGVGGYTHIIGGRTVSQFGATIGRRFLSDKKLGVLLGGTYDFNGRGINDIEPVPTPTSATPHYDSMDFRDYVYYRTRYGLTGSADYKLREGSDISIRGLFSTFRNWGNKWAFTLNDGTTPQFSQDWRRPNLAIGSLALQGNHVFSVSTIKWNVSVSRSRSLGGSGGANYSWVGPFNGQDSDGNPIYVSCVNDQSEATSVYRPGWSATGCGRMSVPSPSNVFDKNNYGLTEYDLPTYGQSVQLNLQASGSYSRLYHFGSHYGTFEFGGKIRNAHKFDDTYSTFYTYDTPEPIANHPEWNGTFTDPVYYDGTYGKYPAVTDWVKVGSWANANQGTFNGGPGINSANFDLIERIPAGYVMNTIELASRLRLVTGVRFEATHVNTLSFDSTSNALSFKGGGDYLDVLPSASLRFALDKDSDLRLVYGRGLSRPDPQDIAQAVSIPVRNQGVYNISLGNPALTAEHANNYDVLYERFLSPLGLIQAGYFYKDLSSPIINTQIRTTTPYPGIPSTLIPPGQAVLVSQPKNAGSAHVQGVEFGFQQRLSYLPGVLSGAGISANYSYTQSSTSGIPESGLTNADGTPVIRPDSPALLRQAPNSWNISPTYDTNHFSMRVGMTFDDKMIYAYQWNGTADQISDPALGVKGPSGDNYLYAHYQFDTQATYKLPKGFEVYAYGLNLNNEVFGFYQGSTQYVVQREYYHPTYAGGLRWNLSRER